MFNRPIPGPAGPKLRTFFGEPVPIYQQLFEGGREGMVRIPDGLQMLIGAFVYREREMAGVFDATLAAIDAR